MSKPFNPQSTVFTNVMLDVIMPSVSPNAWKVLCLAMRKTAGWADLSTISGRKEEDIISLSQFMDGCGIKSENTVISAIEECVNAGYLIKTPAGISFSYRLNTDYELNDTSSEIEEQTSSKIEEVPPQKLRRQTVTINNNKHRTPESNKQETLESLARGFARQKNDEEDRINNYPEDVRPIMTAVCELFSLKCPSIKSNHAGMWIKESRELKDACGEFERQVLSEIAKDFEQHKRIKGGTIPFLVSGPHSLVNSARAKAGELRSKNGGGTTQFALGNGYKIPGGVVYIAGNKYVNGIRVEQE